MIKSGIQLSFSACEKYLLSPMSFFLHYFLKLRSVEQSSALVFGNAIDEGLNSLLLSKDIEAARREFEIALNVKNAVKGTIKYSKADLDDSLLKGIVVPETHDNEWYYLREKGFVMLEAYATQVLPKIKEVLAVQHNISVTNENGDTFVGKVDMIVVWEDNRRILFDNKTASKKYADDAVKTSPQLATYYEILKDEYKLDACGYITIPKNLRKKKEPKCEIQILISETPEELIAKTFEDYDKVLSGIKNAQFDCTGECRKQYYGDCAYAKYCESGGKDLTGLEYKKRQE